MYKPFFLQHFLYFFLDPQGHGAFALDIFIFFLFPIPEVKTWEIRQLDALRKFAGTSTAPSTSSENDHQYQQMRMPRNKQMRMPTVPVDIVTDPDEPFCPSLW